MIQPIDALDAHLITDIIAMGTMVVTIAVTFTKLSSTTATLTKIVEDHEERIRDGEKFQAAWDGYERRRESRP